MARSIGSTRAILLYTISLALCIASVTSAGAAESAANDPMQIVPAEALFCVRINDLNATLGRVDQFLTGIFPFGISMPVRGQLGQILGGPEPKGIDMSGDFAVFGPLPGGDAPNPGRIGILVPVSDYQQFVSGNPNVAAPDAQGISAIGAEGMAIFAATKLGSYALVTTTPNQQALVEMKNWTSGAGTASLAKRLAAGDLKQATDSPVWAYANIQTVSKMFGPLIQAKIEEVKQGFTKGNQDGLPMMERMGGIIDMYTTFLDSAMKETQFVSLALDPTPTALQAQMAMAAVPNTDMAAFFTGGATPPDRKFMGYLEDGAVMNLITKVDASSWSKWNETYIDLLAKLVDTDPSSEEMRSIKKMATDASNALGGTLAMSFGVNKAGKPPFEIRYVVGLKDAAALYRVLDEASKAMNSGPIAEFYESLGMKFQFELKRGAETYKGVTIDGIRVAIQPTNTSSQEGQMISAIYGDGFTGRLAVVDNLLAYVIATDAEPKLRALIDQIKAGTAPQTPGEMKSAMELIPGSEKAGFVGTYNYLRLLQMATAMMPMRVPLGDVASQSNIAMAGNTDEGRMTLNVAVPKQHVLEIMTVFMKMQQQKMMEQQKQQGQM